jgi:hypothetical protein
MITVSHESVRVFIEVQDGFGDDSPVVEISCPMVVDAPITPALTRWVSMRGQLFKLGGCWLNPDSEDDPTTWIYFKYSLLGADLDPAELMHALNAVVHTSNKLDDELVATHGGRLFTADDDADEE